MEVLVGWILSDKMVRAQITAGVIYGTLVREVERFMLQAAAEDSRVLKGPEPFVLFNDFGDSALIFELYFWISMNRLMEQRIIESDMRFRVDALFREAGIVIAFPQRDVHLDTQRPLELRIVDAESRSEEEEGQPGCARETLLPTAGKVRSHGARDQVHTHRYYQIPLQRHRGYADTAHRGPGDRGHCRGKA